MRYLQKEHKLASGKLEHRAHGTCASENQSENIRNLLRWIDIVQNRPRHRGCCNLRDGAVSSKFITFSNKRIVAYIHENADLCVRVELHVDTVHIPCVVL